MEFENFVNWYLLIDSILSSECIKKYSKTLEKKILPET